MLADIIGHIEPAVAKRILPLVPHNHAVKGLLQAVLDDGNIKILFALLEACELENEQEGDEQILTEIAEISKGVWCKCEDGKELKVLKGIVTQCEELLK